MTPKDMIGAGLAKFKNARDDSSSGGGDSDAWSDSDWEYISDTLATPWGGDSDAWSDAD